eukprot:scaffold251_cov134-Isochrysis_galbana.AAC.5
MPVSSFPLLEGRRAERSLRVDAHQQHLLVSTEAGRTLHRPAGDRPLSYFTSWCLKNAVNENAVNGRKTCKRDSNSKEHGRGSRITRTLTKDRRDTLNLDTSPQQDDCWMGDESALSM